MKVVVARIPRKKIKLMLKVKLRTVALNLLFYLAEHVIKATIFIMFKSYGTPKRGKTNTCDKWSQTNMLMETRLDSECVYLRDI